MLTKCPECELQVSDKAFSCPHCGFPFKKQSSTSHKSNKRKRLPNGFGQISKLNNPRLRKPYRAMVTIGKNSKGRPICKLLKPVAYFETYNDAYEALIEYNRNPYDLEEDTTVAQLYERWSDEYFKKLSSKSSERTITAAWNYCSSVYDYRVKDLRARHIKYCMEEGIANINGIEKKPSSHSKARIKSLFNLMLDYAVEYEIVDRNYSRTFDVSDEIISDINKTKRDHIPFTKEEMEILWENINIPYVDVLLIQCYSGWRPQELGLIKLEDVDLVNWTFKGGLKTDAGRDRIVPIHPEIKAFVSKRYKEAVNLGSEYLLNACDSKTHKGSMKLTYDKYQQRFKKIIKALNLNEDHRAHDGRVHFVTMCKKYQVDEYAIKYMVGHAIDDITEKVYTQRDIEWLKTEIEKIKE